MPRLSWYSKQSTYQCVFILVTIRMTQVSDSCANREQNLEWSESGTLSSIYSMQVRARWRLLAGKVVINIPNWYHRSFYLPLFQGRRPNNEDRAAHRRVSCSWEGVGPVHIFTVRQFNTNALSPFLWNNNLATAMLTLVKECVSS